MSVRNRLILLYAGLLAANVLAWAWALAAFHATPVLLGTALLAYGLGLRHAVDADHIAAIDNVTRKLMQGGQRPLGVGLFFSLGHSAVVVLAFALIGFGAGAFRGRLAGMHAVGNLVGTLVSVVFLLAIGGANLAILVSVRRHFRRLRAGEPVTADALNRMLAGGGALARLLRPALGIVGCSWHMVPLGFLFGLGFDTATEIGLLGISAAEASRGSPVWSILVFPALFTAGMALIDTTDSVLMLGAYGWAFVEPARKVHYNITITSVSVLVAFLVGGIEALGLLNDRFGWRGPFWDLVALLNGHFGLLGYLIVAMFAASWAISAAVYRIRGYGRLPRQTPHTGSR